MGKKLKAFIVDLRQRGIDARIKFVQFFDGIGVLDAKALAECRPDWFKPNQREGLEQIAGIDAEGYSKYWADKGAKVTTVSPEEAERIRRMLIAGERIDDKYYDEPPAGEDEEKAETAEQHLTGEGEGDQEPAGEGEGDEEKAEDHLPSEPTEPEDPPEGDEPPAGEDEEKDSGKKKSGKGKK